MSTKEPNAQVVTLSEKLMAAISIDNKTGTTTVQPDIYDANLPEGVTSEVIKKISDYDTNFVAAGQHALGNVAIKAIKENSELNKVSADIPMGYKNNLHVSFTGKVEGPEGKDTVYGVTEAILTVRAGNNGAQSKIVRNMLGELAQNAFSS